MNENQPQKSQKSKTEQQNGTMFKEEKTDPFFYCFLHVNFFGCHSICVRLKIEKPAFFTNQHNPNMKRKEKKIVFFRSVCSVSFSNWIKMLPRIENNIIVYKTFQCDFVTRKKSIQFYTHTHTSEKAHTIFDQTLMQEKN